MRGPLRLTGAILPLLFLFAASPSAAQPGAPAPKAGAGGKAPPAAAAPAPAPPPAPDVPPAPPKIEVNDPLLGALPPPAHTVNGWREALNLISARSVDLAIAKQEVERAEGLRRQALGAALTTITATGSVTQQIIQNTGPGAPQTFQITLNGMTVDVTQTPKAQSYQGPTALASLTASQPVLAPRAWYAIGTADLNVKSAKLSENDKRRTSLGQVAGAIVNVYTAERVAEINRVGLRNALQHLDLAQRKARLGDGTRLDVLRAEQDVQTARSTLIAGDEQLLKARETLGLAFGSPESYGVPPTISLNEMEQALRSTCSPGNPDQRADVVQARNDLEVAKRGVTDAKLAFAPTAVVSTTLSGSNQITASGKDYAWSIQGVLSIPLWEGGARYGALRIARANEEEARIRLEALGRSATIDAVQSMRGVIVAEQARQVAEHNRDLARESARLAEKAYAAGAGTSFDLVDTSRQERAAELNLAVQEFDLISAKITALLATANCSY